MDGGRRQIGRKILVASLGVATVSFVACGQSSPSTTDAAVEDGSMADASESKDGPNFTSGGDGGTSDAGVDRQFIGNII
jgi:hypothetical protein